MTGGAWSLIDSKGETALTFASFLDLSSDKGGSVATYPLEEGSFTSYNKTQTPRAIQVNLGMEGDDAELDHTLLRLDEYQREALLLTVATPASLHKNMTLESYSYRRTREGNAAGMLIVELTLKEIREARTQVKATVITKPKNPTSVKKQDGGRKQTK